MSVWFYFFPFIAAVIGWLASRLGIALFIKKIKSQQRFIATKVGDYAAAQLPIDTLAAQLTNNETLEKILPFAEAHIDDFLRTKLPAAMPVLAMFISDKLVGDMKIIFMKELKELIPALINQYISNAKESFNISKLIADKIAAINIRQVTILLKKQFLYIEAYGAITGFVIGVVAFFLTRVA